ncbi:MAG: hypothetical protein EXR47_06245 [Dehalococcoidia bacterium]|nr:hypothetical protein [Dehalococcoidia bacterium]
MPHLAVLPSELTKAGLDLRALQPVAGRFVLDGGAVCFIPRFPFLDGAGYSLLLFPASADGRGDPETWTIQRPARTGVPETTVVAIYPTTDELPVNQLKLYVHFSHPMSEGWAARAVHVLRLDTHERLADVFLRMEPELWDPDRKRLTLLLDPGRIKRGLIPNQEAGYPLTEGAPVVVTIDASFRDATGRPLRAGAEQRYQVGPVLLARIDPVKWRLQQPAAGSTDPLTVEFDRPLDHALLQHCLWINDAAGAPLAGQASVGQGERSWRFQPQSPWKEGHHSVIVDPRLEDLAGNSLMRVFDRDLTRAEDTPADARHVAIDFMPRAALQKSRYLSSKRAWRSDHVPPSSAALHCVAILSGARNLPPFLGLPPSLVRASTWPSPWSRHMGTPPKTARNSTL